MFNNNEPYYRIQKHVFEGFCMALNQNSDHKSASIQLIGLYKEVQVFLDTHYPATNRKKRDLMKKTIWKTFFNGLLNKKVTAKKTFNINKKGYITWQNKETGTDLTNKMYLTFLGGACRNIIDETGDKHLEMFEQVFIDLEKQYK